MQHRIRSFKELEKLVKKEHGEHGVSELGKSHHLALKIHKDEKRLSGKPFITHLINTAYILGKLELDIESICAGMLHDSLDKNADNYVLIEKELGKETAQIVKELGKLDEIANKNMGKVNDEDLGRVLLATSNDLRSILVELAASLDNFRSIQNVDLKAIEKNAKLCMAVKVPVAHKLGLYEIEWELKDLAFKVINPKAYDRIKKTIKGKRANREKKIKKAVAYIQKILKKNAINAEVTGRPKDFYGIYKKGKIKKVKIREIHDLLGARIICDSVVDCYRALGVVHHEFTPKGHFDDYIAHPKPNNYQSLHTSVEIDGEKIEVQIRTWEMHRIAEEGVAAHWMYKEFSKDRYFDKQLTWAKQLIEWQRKLDNKKDFVKSMRLGFDRREIFVFTPRKELVSLPENSTPLDFAYAVHTELGHKAEKAFINDRIVPLDAILENGDSVKIIGAKRNQVKNQWLSIVRSARAKTKIRQKLGLKKIQKKTSSQFKRGGSITTANPLVRLAECCKPLPGDTIIGYRTTKRRISVHRRNCRETSKFVPERIVIVTWVDSKSKYSTKLKVSGIDRPGLLTDLLKILTVNKASVTSADAKVSKNNITACIFDVGITSPEQLEKIIQSMQQTDGISTVERI